MSLKNLSMWIIVLIAIIVGIIGYGLFWVWYQTTVFEDVHMPSFEPQKKPGALALPSATVMTERKEPRLVSRVAARMLKNPIPPTEESLRTGKKLYLTFCAPCHGKEGEGQGLMGTVPNLAPLPEKETMDLRNYLGGFSQLTPPQLNLNFVWSLPDGDIFYTITYGGYSIMPGFKDALSPEQRWQLINYIKVGVVKK